MKNNRHAIPLILTAMATLASFLVLLSVVAAQPSPLRLAAAIAGFAIFAGLLALVLRAARRERGGAGDVDRMR